MKADKPKWVRTKEDEATWIAAYLAEIYFDSTGFDQFDITIENKPYSVDRETVKKWREGSRMKYRDIFTIMKYMVTSHTDGCSILSTSSTPYTTRFTILDNRLWITVDEISTNLSLMQICCVDCDENELDPSTADLSQIDTVHINFLNRTDTDLPYRRTYQGNSTIVETEWEPFMEELLSKELYFLLNTIWGNSMEFLEGLKDGKD